MDYDENRLSFFWRLILIPLFIYCVLSIEEFAFLRTQPFASGHLLNWLMLVVCFAGLLLAMFAGARARILIAAALILWLAPMWLKLEYSSGAVIKGFQADSAIAMLTCAPAALWGLMAVRAGEGREWTKPILALALTARTAALIIFGDGKVIWIDELILVISASVVGTFIDAVYSGITLSALISFLVSGAWLALTLFAPDFIGKPVFMWLLLAVSALVGAAMLITRDGKQRMGRALTILGALTCVLALYFEGEM